MKTCLICDDHIMMREALAGAVASGWPGVDIIEAPDFTAACEAAAAGPDLIITDLIMPGASPVDGVSRLRRAAPTTPILVVTGHEDDAVLLALFELGIAGFAPKTSRGKVIDAAIHLILAGGRYVPPRIVELATRRGADGAAPPAAAVAARLTGRQTDVLKLIATGESNKQIARALDLSPATIKAHIAAAIATLGAVNRTDAVVKARANGLI